MPAGCAPPSRIIIFIQQVQEGRKHHEAQIKEEEMDTRHEADREYVDLEPMIPIWVDRRTLRYRSIPHGRDGIQYRGVVKL